MKDICIEKMKNSTVIENPAQTEFHLNVIVDDIQRYMKHIIRSTWNQKKIPEIKDMLQPHQAYIIIDWAQKFNPYYWHESME